MKQNTIFLSVISGLSEESVQIREIQSILDGLFCVQGKEGAYGRKEGIVGLEISAGKVELIMKCLENMRSEC